MNEFTSTDGDHLYIDLMYSCEHSTCRAFGNQNVFINRLFEIDEIVKFQLAACNILESKKTVSSSA